MKKFLLLAGFLFQIGSAMAQLTFENISYDAALLKSKQTGKLIFLQFESQNCKQCNEVADKAFSDKELGELLQETFVCIKIVAEHPDRNQISSKYNKKEGGFGSLFITSDETLIHHYPGSTTLVKTYKEHIDKALFAAGEGLKLSSLESQYKSGIREPLFLESYMFVKKTLGLDTDTLLEEYVRLIPEDSLKSKRTLLFISQMSPIIGSHAEYQLRKNYYTFVEAWKQQPGNIRIATNNRIVYKSIQKAIREKNETYAYKVADFSRRTYEGDPKAGQKAYENEMLKYYLGIKDTLNYLIRSVYYYDNNFMTISVDSIKRRDSLSMAVMFNKATPQQIDSIKRIVRKTIAFSPSTQYYNRELYSAASIIYKMSNDKLYLQKAIMWAKKANEFYEHYNSFNTLAQLYYKAGQKEEAIQAQEKAIALKKKMGFDTKDLEKELLDIRNNNLK